MSLIHCAGLPAGSRDAWGGSPFLETAWVVFVAEWIVAGVGFLGDRGSSCRKRAQKPAEMREGVRCLTLGVTYSRGSQGEQNQDESLSDGLGLGGWDVERRVGPGWGPPWVTVTASHLVTLLPSMCPLKFCSEGIS